MYVNDPSLISCLSMGNQCRIYHCAYVCICRGPCWPEGPHFPANKIVTMDFCLCGAILNLKAFCFGAIPDIMIELIAYWSVTQSRQSWQWLSGIETKLLGASGYWQKKIKDGFMLTRCNFKFDGVLFNLDTYRRTY